MCLLERQLLLLLLLTPSRCSLPRAAGCSRQPDCKVLGATEVKVQIKLQGTGSPCTTQPTVVLALSACCWSALNNMRAAAAARQRLRIAVCCCWPRLLLLLLLLPGRDGAYDEVAAAAAAAGVALRQQTLDDGLGI
jgi:hypothetical protein